MNEITPDDLEWLDNLIDMNKDDSDSPLIGLARILKKSITKED